MKKFSIGVVGALLLASLGAVAGETLVAVNTMKKEMPARERVEPKRRATQPRAQKRTSRPEKRDTSLDWPQLG